MTIPDTSPTACEEAAAYLEQWARDIRAMNGQSADADRMDRHAAMLRALVAERDALREGLALVRVGVAQALSELRELPPSEPSPKASS